MTSTIGKIAVIVSEEDGGPQFVTHLGKVVQDDTSGEQQNLLVVRDGAANAEAYDKIGLIAAANGAGYKVAFREIGARRLPNASEPEGGWPNKLAPIFAARIPIKTQYIRVGGPTG